MIHDQLFEGISFRDILLRFTLITSQLMDFGQSIGISVHITVDGGSGIFFSSAAADRLFHAILHIALPVKIVWKPVRGFPTLILCIQVR